MNTKKNLATKKNLQNGRTRGSCGAKMSGGKGNVLRHVDMFSNTFCLLNNNITPEPAKKHSLSCVMCLGLAACLHAKLRKCFLTGEPADAASTHPGRLHQ